MSEELTRLYRLMDRPEYPSECVRMQEILARAGYAATISDIEWAWKRYSDEFYSAGWLRTDEGDDNYILSGLLNFLQPEE